MVCAVNPAIAGSFLYEQQRADRVGQRHCCTTLVLVADFDRSPPSVSSSFTRTDDAASTDGLALQVARGLFVVPAPTRMAERAATWHQQAGDQVRRTIAQFNLGANRTWRDAKTGTGREDQAQMAAR